MSTRKDVIEALFANILSIDVEDWEAVKTAVDEYGQSRYSEGYDKAAAEARK